MGRFFEQTHRSIRVARNMELTPPTLSILLHLSVSSLFSGSSEERVRKVRLESLGCVCVSVLTLPVLGHVEYFRVLCNLKEHKIIGNVRELQNYTSNR